MPKYGPYARGFGGARDVQARAVRRKRRWRPTPTQIRSSKAQGRYIASQGRAIERIADTQQTYARAGERVTGRPSLTATPRREKRQQIRRKRARDRRRQIRIARIREQEFLSQGQAIAQ